ncbi:MAG TPA: hypothetical protein VLT33_03025 [Labilithrix sp.]|nr:hypothetical protein [Labilithrix sp.]
MRSPLLVLVRWRGDIIATYDRLPPAAPLVSECDGVSVEVYDVGVERAALSLRPRVDLRPIAGFLASLALHVSVAAAIVLALTAKDRIAEIIADKGSNDQGAVLQDPVIRIAANENAAERPKDERPPAPADEHARPEPPPAPETTAVAAAHGSSGKDTVSTSRSVCAPPKNLAPNDGPRCQRTVTLSAVSTRPSCYVDTVAHAGDTGTLTYPCEGDGEATLTFGNRAFAGASVGGKINVCTGTEYPWSDGCKWTSAQRVTGTVASGSLRFTYGEAPKVGEHDCWSACDATATVRVEGESWRSAP